MPALRRSAMSKQYAVRSMQKVSLPTAYCLLPTKPRRLSRDHSPRSRLESLCTPCEQLAFEWTEYAEIALGCQGQSPQKALYGTSFPLPMWEGTKGRGNLQGCGRARKRLFTVRKDCGLINLFEAGCSTVEPIYCALRGSNDHSCL